MIDWVDFLPKFAYRIAMLEVLLMRFEAFYRMVSELSMLHCLVACQFQTID